jgi:hypothetical protein
MEVSVYGGGDEDASECKERETEIQSIDDVKNAEDVASQVVCPLGV